MCVKNLQLGITVDSDKSSALTHNLYSLPSGTWLEGTVNVTDGDVLVGVVLLSIYPKGPVRITVAELVPNLVCAKFTFNVQSELSVVTPLLLPELALLLPELLQLVSP